MFPAAQSSPTLDKQSHSTAVSLDNMKQQQQSIPPDVSLAIGDYLPLQDQISIFGINSATFT